MATFSRRGDTGPQTPDGMHVSYAATAAKEGHERRSRSFLVLLSLVYLAAHPTFSK